MGEGDFGGEAAKWNSKIKIINNNFYTRKGTKKNKGRNTAPPSPDFKIRFNRPLHGEWPLPTSSNGRTPSDRLPEGPRREHRICR